jgi:ubiquinol-cytochrome c reductase cytochrome b subunit
VYDYNSFYGLCFALGSNEFLGSNGNYQSFSTIPFIGKDVVEWLWGGPSVDNATLTRFYSLHFFLPFVITGLVLIHMFLLHLSGSNNPLGINFGSDSGITFSPFYLVKDLYGLFLFLSFFALFLFFAPNLLGHPDNYIQANPLVTPPHIVPEWYFLPFYAILRSLPDKLAGVIALVLAIISLFLLPFIHFPETRSMRFRPMSKIAFWCFVLVCLILGWLGGKPIETPYLILGQIATFLYFAYFYLFAPFIIYIERLIWLPKLK